MQELKNPDISIIVPVYNVEKYLPQCLESLINQTYANIEIICVNDGSTDNSLEILDKYAKRDSRIIVINQKNSGVSVARNAALKIISGKYLMFVDGDDWIELNNCETAYNLIEKYNADVVMWSYIREYPNKALKKTFHLMILYMKRNMCAKNYIEECSE